MQKEIINFIQEHNMLQAGDHVVAGVSGGADSVCLLHVLASVREELGIRLTAVHVHHGLRGAEADRDAQFTEELAEKLGVPCFVVREHADVYARENGMSVEEAGRVLRYRHFYEIGGPEAKIAVAHHRDDQAETILYNLFRGSGLRGMRGMLPVHGQVIRPLLCVSRGEIRKYLEENELSCCEDSTNMSQDYVRNRLRTQLIPEICRTINSGAAEHILLAGERCREADAYFEAEAEKLWNAHGVGTQREQGIPCRVLTEHPAILSGYVVMGMIRRQCGGMKDITSRHVDQILAIAGRGTGRCVCLPQGLKARTEYGMLWIGPESAAEALPADNFRFSRFPREKNQEILQNRYTKWFDYDKIKGMLSVRTRQPGDYLTLKGGGKKSVKSFMIDEKIPRQERDRIPLVADGSHVLWIAGYRISEHYKVTDTTKEILQVQMTDGGEEDGRQDSCSDS